MKCVVVGNLARRVEIKGKKKVEALGGAPYYAAVTAARLGCETTLITRLSNNFPEKWIKEVEKEGIKIIKQPAWQDTHYEVEYTEDKKIVKVISDAGDIITAPKLEADIVLITNNISKVKLNVLKQLKTFDNILSLDAQSFITYKDQNNYLTHVPWLNKEEYLRYVDILKLNANELYYLTGKKTINSAMELLKWGPKVVSLTLAREGAYVFNKKKFFRVPVYETKTVDKTGVGDVFSAAFAYWYRKTEDMLDSAYFASAAASFCVEKKGAKGIAKLEKVMKRYKTLKEIFLA